MASKVKKLFHRKKDNELESEPQSPPQRMRRSTGGRDSSTFRHSLYENTTSAGDPQTGDYPMQSNGSQSYLPGRRSHGQRPVDMDAAYSPPLPKQQNPPGTTTYPSQSAYNQQESSIVNAVPSQPAYNRQNHSAASTYPSQPVYNQHDQHKSNGNSSTAPLSQEFPVMSANNSDGESPF